MRFFLGFNVSFFCTSFFEKHCFHPLPFNIYFLHSPHECASVLIDEDGLGRVIMLSVKPKIEEANCLDYRQRLGIERLGC